MKNLYYILLIIFSFSGLFFQTIKAQETEVIQTKLGQIAGSVKSEIGEPLVGVYIQVEGTTVGTLTDIDGNFTLKIKEPLPVVLIFSLQGYATQREDILAFDSVLSVTLTSEYDIGKEVVISASRISENILQSSVTVERVDMLAIKEMPATSAYDNMASIKGVDMITSSLTFKSINTRGFNTPANSRFVQRIDGVDLQTPGLNVPVGMLSGSSDLDIESIELVPGTSSALYGPNAFNGMLNITTKNPFQYPGLSVQLKAGFNHLDNRDANTALYNDMAIRYAKCWKDKLGVKINIAYASGTDWMPGNYQDMSNYAGTNDPNNRIVAYGNSFGNPGYDGLNTYGDEVANIFDKSVNPFLDTLRVKIARTGYAEKDVTSYKTGFIKADAGVYYKLTSNAELSLTSRIARGSSVLQADNRMALRNFWIHTHKMELKGANYFIRCYATIEDAGDSYDTRFAAINVNRAWKSDTNWFAQYQMIYSGTMNFFNDLAGLGLPYYAPYNDAVARSFADSDNSALMALFGKQEVRELMAGFGQDPDLLVQLLRGSDRLIPGSKAFNDALEKVKTTENFNKGAKFVDKTQLYHLEGQYDLSKQIKFAEILVGGNARVFNLNSRGLIFGDTAGNIVVSEFGAYVQVSRKFLKKMLKVTASGRVDKVVQFNMQFSPRIAAVLSFGKHKQHNLRASYQTGFKMPDLRHRYINFAVGTFQVVGGFKEDFKAHGLSYGGAEGMDFNNTYTLSSVESFLVSKDSSVLQRQLLEPIKPEFLQSMEVGYKGMLVPGLLLDVSAYFNRYTNFIGSYSFIGPLKKDVGTEDVGLSIEEILTPATDGSERFQRFRQYGNSTNPVNSFGVSAGIIWFLSQKFSINSNYSYAELIEDENQSSNFINEFNTPRHKCNVTFSARNIFKRFGFAVAYRFNDAYMFQYSFGSGMVPAYQLVDAQVSYKLPKLKSTVKVGGTNILNNRHIEMYGGPTVGALVYLQVSYDSFLN